MLSELTTKSISSRLPKPSQSLLRKLVIVSGFRLKTFHSSAKSAVIDSQDSGCPSKRLGGDQNLHDMGLFDEFEGHEVSDLISAGGGLFVLGRGIHQVDGEMF